MTDAARAPVAVFLGYDPRHILYTVTHYNSRYWQAIAPCSAARVEPNVLPSNFAVYMRMKALPAPVAWMKSSGVGKSRNILTPSSVCAIGIHWMRSWQVSLYQLAIGGLP